MATFNLSAVLEGHADDVRAVAFPQSSLLLTSSRDGTVRQWVNEEDKSHPKYQSITSSTRTPASISSLAFVPPTDRFPKGLIVSGDQDGLIDVRSPNISSQGNPDALLAGHTHSVSTLSISNTGSHIISGSWDSTARIWIVGDWVAEPIVLEEHDGTVWATTTIIFGDEELVLTGSAGGSIRIFELGGKKQTQFTGSTQPIRALCPLPSKKNSYNAHFASAGNDCLVKIWALGQDSPVAILKGHKSFIYSLDILPTGEIVSASEDRSIRIWSGMDSIQTITHPAISIWSVAVCPSTGDIVTGSSDKIARVFSRDPQRIAALDVLESFRESNKIFATPAQTVGDGKVSTEDLPGPEFIRTKSGTKDGQIQMVKADDGSVSVYQWSQGPREWILIGSMVGSAGSSGRKVEYQGKMYDFVFDVDVEDGKPALKLPFNLSQNPYDAARVFLAKNELPLSYLDSTANFIMKNTKGYDIESSDSQVQKVPSKQNPTTATPRSALTLPLTDFLVITETKLALVKKKLLSLNDDLKASGLGFSKVDAEVFEQTFATLAEATSSLSASSAPPAFSADSRALFLNMASTWPETQRFPVLDILRLLAAFSPEIAGPVVISGNNSTVYPSLLSFLIDPDSPAYVFSASAPMANIFMGLRTISNVFNTREGKEVAQINFDRVMEVMKAFIINSSSSSSGPSSRLKERVAVLASKPHKEQLLVHNRDIAVATVLLNYSVLLTGKRGVGTDEENDGLNASSDGSRETTGPELELSSLTRSSSNNPNTDSTVANRTMTMVSSLVDLVTQLTYTHDPTAGTDPKGGHMDEALFRALAALGTVLLGSEPAFIELAYDAFNFQALVDAVAEAGKGHPRIAALLQEMEAGLGQLRV